MKRYIVSQQLPDGTWYGRGSITATSPEEAIEKIKRIVMKRAGEWKAKIAPKAVLR